MKLFFSINKSEIKFELHIKFPILQKTSFLASIVFNFNKIEISKFIIKSIKLKSVISL